MLGYSTIQDREIITGDSEFVNTLTYGTKYVTYQTENVKYLMGFNGLYTSANDIPNDVTALFPYLFYDNKNVYSITIPSSVTDIGNSAFYQCYKLVQLKNLTSIQTSNFFYNTNTDMELLTQDVAFASAITYGEKYVTYQTGNKTYLLGFNGNTYSSATDIPNDITNIYDYAFYNNKSLTSVVIPNNIKGIGKYAFYGANIESIEIPESITEIGGDAFHSCSRLSSVTLNNGLKTINGQAFDGCSKLQTIIIPNTVTTIGIYTFASCPNLTVYAKVGSKPDGWTTSLGAPWDSFTLPVYWYSESEPSTEGNYWHYVDGVPTIWA